MARVMHEAEKSLGRDELIKRLSAKYLPETQAEQHPAYAGVSNEKLDRDITTGEVETTLWELNTRPPGIENLRQISLTSCVGKVLEHVLVNRWQDYLEQEGLYPDSMIGFPRCLSTQDAMIQLKQEIIENETRDNTVILGLDLQSAFDRVQHSTILAQVTKLNMTERSYEYIKNFLSGRSIELHSGEIEPPERNIGSVGTPQGSVISPLRFNIVMIRVTEAVAGVKGVRHTIYDITLWTTGGMDASIESRLQRAVSAIKERLDGTGLQCSPSKSELLVYSPRKAGRPRLPPGECDRLVLITKTGQRCPEVPEIEVLGILISGNDSKDTLMNKLTIKTASTVRLIQHVSSKQAGMREEGLARLVQSFTVSHIAYTAAYHMWSQTDKNKIDTMIRSLYKRALGLKESTNTERLMQLGVHNTVGELVEALLAAQRERLAGPRRAGPYSRPWVHPEPNRERRRPGAKCLIKQYSGDPRTRYVDAADYGKGRYAHQGLRFGLRQL
ncbi:uncharacterized protein LOC144156149 [Haemaphysalis longicornis]